MAYIHTFFRLPAFELFTNFQSQFPKRRLPSHPNMGLLSLEAESKMAQLPKNYAVIQRGCNIDGEINHKKGQITFRWCH